MGIHQILSNRTDTKPQIMAGHGDPEGEKRSITQAKESEPLLTLLVVEFHKTRKIYIHKLYAKDLV